MTSRSSVGLVLLAAACAGRPVAPTVPAAVAAPPVAPGEPPEKSPSTVVLEPLRIIVGSVEGTSSVYDARTLFEEGNDALMQREHEDALAQYDRLLADFPESKLVPLVLYNAGLAHEGRRDYVSAAERYRRLLSRPQLDADSAVDAEFRLGAVLAEAERYAEAAKVFETVLLRETLTPSSRIEALARLGYALIETQDLAGAEEILRAALAYAREIQGTSHLENDYYVGMCQYYLGEIPHRQFDAVPLRMPREQLERDIAHKSDLFLLARDRFIKTVEVRNPYWATAAVYQIGLMYKTFWDQFMAVPIPSELAADAAAAYVQAINEEPELRKLLEKAILYHERNVTMAKNAHVSTLWSEASVAAAEEVRKVFARQSSGQQMRPGEGAGGPPSHEVGGTSEANREKEYIPSRAEL